jgi:hypothetical protein
MKSSVTDTNTWVLGILQAQENPQQDVLSKTTHIYFKRIKQVLKPKLNGQNKIQTINTYAMPVLSYRVGSVTDKEHAYKWMKCHEHAMLATVTVRLKQKLN